MGLVLVTEDKPHQTEMYTPTPSQQCVEANGAGAVQPREVDKQECRKVGVQ
jgi:hypothetical protein